MCSREKVHAPPVGWNCSLSLENQVLPCVICLQSLVCNYHGKVTSPGFFPSIPLEVKMGRTAQCLLGKQKENTKRKKKGLGGSHLGSLFLPVDSPCLSCPHFGTYLPPSPTTRSKESRPCHCPSLIPPVNVLYPANSSKCCLKAQRASPFKTPVSTVPDAS